MKLDKVRFARLLNFIGARLGCEMSTECVADLDDIIDIAIPEVPQGRADAEQLDRLMFLMAQGIQKIEAIKAHRAMTGYGLKESKDAVEKYWVAKEPANKGATLGDILGKATTQRPPVNFDKFEG